MDTIKGGEATKTHPSGQITTIPKPKLRDFAEVPLLFTSFWETHGMELFIGI